MPKFITKAKQDELERINSDSFADWRSDLNDKLFIIFPEELLFRKDFTDGELRFYQKLFALSDKSKGVLYHSNAKLAELFHCSEDNVKHFLKLLKKKKAIDVLSTGIHNKRVICLTPWNL